jgi:4-hydroxybenzoate polyprenyltransferase
MKFKKIAFASLLYAIWTVLIGYLIPPLAIWTSVISAIVAGIYVGRKNNISSAVF